MMDGRYEIYDLFEELCPALAQAGIFGQIY